MQTACPKMLFRNINIKLVRWIWKIKNIKRKLIIVRDPVRTSFFGWVWSRKERFINHCWEYEMEFHYKNKHIITERQRYNEDDDYSKKKLERTYKMEEDYTYIPVLCVICRFWVKVTRPWLRRTHRSAYESIFQMKLNEVWWFKKLF